MIRFVVAWLFVGCAISACLGGVAAFGGVAKRSPDGTVKLFGGDAFLYMAQMGGVLYVLTTVVFAVGFVILAWATAPMRRRLDTESGSE
jgi:membrane protein implicated in regulation of membrane protease activity